MMRESIYGTSLDGELAFEPAADGSGLRQALNVDAAARLLPLRFTGRASEYFRIWIVGVALSLLTFGVYSAWAKVRTQQYFYRHTWLDGASFEYLAEPRELLRGRLVLATVLAASFAIQMFYSPASLLVLLAAIAAMPWIVVRSVAFRAKSSAFRNVRFGFSSRLGAAYASYARGYLMFLLSAGLAYPSVRWRQVAYVLERLRFGAARVAWRTSSDEFYASYAKSALWLLPAVALLAFSRLQQSPVLSGTPVLLTTYTCLFLASVQLRAESANLIYGGVQIGPHRLRSRQRFWPLLFIYLTNTLAVVATLGLLIPWARVRLARYRIDALTLECQGALDVMSQPDPTSRLGYGDAAADLGGIDLGIG